MKKNRYFEELRIIARQRTAERDYWFDKLSGELEKCNFPYDYKNKEDSKPAAAVLEEKFPKGLSAGLIKLSVGSDVKLHIILTAALVLLLDKYTGKKDIITGMPILKPDVDTDADFTNTAVALRHRIKENMSFKELLFDVRQTYADAVDNQFYPIEILIDELGLSFIEGDFPLFDVAIMVENINEKNHLSHVTPNMIFSFSRVDEDIECSLEYNPKKYDRSTPKRIMSHFKRLLHVVLADVNIEIAGVDILSQEEKKQLLYEFNDTLTLYPKEKKIQALFAEQVEKSPDSIALLGEAHLFPGKNGKTPSLEPVCLTYRQLDRKTGKLADVLTQNGIGPGAIAALAVERSIEMIVGILAVLKAGGAYLPIDPQYPPGRQAYMLKDSNAGLLLTARSLEKEAEKLQNLKINIIFIDETGSGKEQETVPTGARRTAPGKLEPGPLAGRLAYIMYTSGSTGKAKGVMVEHRNVVRLVVGTDYVALNNKTRILLTGAPVFDATTFEIWGALLNGGVLGLVEREIILDAGRLGEALLKNKINTMWLTSPLFNQLMQQDGNIFCRMRYLLVGGDVLSPRYINKVRRNNSRLKLINGYGPTENTTFSTTYLIDKKFTENIPIGKPIANSTAYILDKNGGLQLPGAPGELVVGGDGVARGYLNSPELTAEKFIDNPFSSGTRSYRTGDLTRWLPTGDIEFCGRIDYQVKIRGFRVEPEEIESQLLLHEDVKEAVVTVAVNSGENHLCAYIVGKVDGVSGLRRYLAERMPAYMIPSSFTFLDKMPLTISGKIDRRALPEPEAQAAGIYVAPRDDVEKRMTVIWSGVLGIAEKKIGIDDNFFELGGHSIKATKLVYFIHKEFEISIKLKEVFTNPCIRQLVQIIKAAETKKYAAITAVEEKEYYAMSYAQRRLWVLCQFEEDSTAYNMPGAIVFAGIFNVDAFTKAIQALTDRHESLRTVFIPVAGAPFQKVIKDFKFNLEQVDFRGLDEKIKEEKLREVYLEDTNRSFDLEHGPLFRFKLAWLEEKKYLLIHNFHHIINDGWSQGNIYNEIIILYNSFRADKDNPFPPLELQYKDYTRWHNNLIAAGRFNESRDYWVDKFKDKPNGIEFPIDHPRKPLQTFNGGRISFAIDSEKTARLSQVSMEEDVTFFMTLLALITIFLYKYSGQEDILIGSPIANRRQPELHPIVGFLVNTLVFRNKVNPGLSFIQFLKELKRETLTSYEYQDYPFDLLVEQLELERDLSQSPLFNFMLAHNNVETEDSEMVMEGLKILPFAYSEDFNMSKFDLVFHLNEFADYIYPSIEYNSDLFDRSTIERMAGNFLVLINRVMANTAAPISSLDIISEAEYEQIIHRFNETSYPFPELTVRQLFENQVEKSGDNDAVIYRGDKITYNHLNTEANRLAHYLRNKYHGKPNDIIGISMDRSIDMIVVMLGIIKSGAAYLAVDPTYPKDRVLHVLNNSRSDILITDKMRPELFASYTGEILVIDACRDAVSQESAANPAPVNRLADILYVNYTSGSTGMPNGAMLSHACLANLIQWQNEKTTIDCSKRCLQFTSINFCVSFQEIMGALTSGGELYLIGDIERQDIDYLLDFLSVHQIAILFLPFSYLNFLFNESTRWNQEFKHSLKHIITAGEQLKITSGLKRFLDLNPDLQLHNHYGSTEMHVVTSYTLDSSTAGKTPIPPAGKPVSNVKIYILDDYLNPVPIGVWGEIFVAGRSEILGYINNDVLNEEKLALHPVFSKNGKRLYRSGDSGRWLEDGNIELRGRKDYLVKIRGFRVELGEIESKLLAIDRVRECVVVDREDRQGQKYLAAYMAVEGIEVDEIKRRIGNDLPQYMIPKFILLNSLPLMPNGKVDRDKLPDPETESGLEPLTIAAISSLLEDDKKIEDLLAGKDVLPTETPLKKAVAGYTHIYRQFFSPAAWELSGIEVDIFPRDEFLSILTRDKEAGSSAKMNVAQLFENQVEKNPDKTALVSLLPLTAPRGSEPPGKGNNGKYQTLTYRELNDQANRLAQVIINKGARPGVIVAVLTGPSVEMVVSLLAVLKAGAAYLIISPGTSLKQVTNLLKENHVVLLLSNSRITQTYSYTALLDLSSGSALWSRSPARPPIADLDSLPLPDRSLVNYEKYNRHIGITMVKDCITILSSRGCPYNCAYCHKIWPKKQVCRSAENIFREVKLYYDMGVRRFAFIDDIFNLDIKNSSRFFEMLLKHGIKAQFFFSGGLRGDILTPGFIDLMVKAGTVGIAVALETASPRLQKLIGKNLNVEKLRKNLEYICRTYPEVILEMHTMHGFPSESEAESRMTLDYIKSLHWLDFPYIHMVRIYPNTEMERIALQHGVAKEAVLDSEGLAYHEWSGTSPFEKSFTWNYQAEFLNDYFLSKERLRHVLPRQMKILTEADMVQKYHSYLPVEIKSLDDLLKFADIDREELPVKRCQPDNAMQVPGFNRKLARQFPPTAPGKKALRVLLLDLSQNFSADGMLFDVVESPLGLISLLTYLNLHLGDKIHGKIAKARADFDNYSQLKTKIEEFDPHVIGIRTLTFYKDFFHLTAAAIRHWGIDVPIIAGGPYASGDYNTVLQDPNVNAVVYGEGEVTFLELIKSMMSAGGKLPDDNVMQYIPGLVFIPRQEAGKTTGNPGVREIVMLDQLPPAAVSAAEPAERLEPAAGASDTLQIMYPVSGAAEEEDGARVEVTQAGIQEILTLLEKPAAPTACLLFDGGPHQVFPALCRGGGLIIPPGHLRVGNIQSLKFYDNPLTHIHLSVEENLRTGILHEETISLPQGEYEYKLVEIWSEILGIEKERIGIDANFFDIGGHSLRATTLVSKIHKEFDVKMPLVEIFKSPVIAEIAKYIKSLGKDKFFDIESSEKKEYHELSYNQKRLWILHQLNPESPALNMPSRFEMDHKVDAQALKKTLNHLVARHGSLRTGFKKVNEEPVQFIAQQVEIALKEIDISTLDEEAKQEKRERIYADTAESPFTLTRAPLFRTVLIKLAEERYEFMYNLHHIISDGWSMEIIKNEFFFLYEGYKASRKVNPAPQQFEYIDFSEWHNKQIKKPDIKKNSHRFWKSQLAEGILALELPVISSGGSENLQGAGYMVRIDEELKEKLKKMAVANNTTLFAVMFSVYIIMLFRFSRQKDIACSIIGAGRDHLSLHNIIGFFVNSILFKIEVQPEEIFSEFLQRVHTHIIETFKAQNYPLELVCRDLKIRYPEISVSFNMLNIQEKAGEQLPAFEHHHIAQVQDVKFDLEPYVTEYKNAIQMYWVYKRKLFKPENIEHIIEEYIKLLDFFTTGLHKSYKHYQGKGKKQKFKK